MKASLRIVVFVLAVFNSLSRGDDSCTSRFLGSTGDTIYIGTDLYPEDPNFTGVFIDGFFTIAKDSSDSLGRRYWWIDDPEQSYYVRQEPNGVVSALNSDTVLFEYIRLCESVGSVWPNQTYVCEYLGLKAITLMKNKVMAKAVLYSRKSDEGVLEPEKIEYFIDKLGLVLRVDVHHGTTSNRVVGAVIDGVRYGTLTTSITVKSVSRPRLYNAYGDRIKLSIDENVPIELVLRDLRGQILLRYIGLGNDEVDVAHLATGVYSICLQINTSMPRFEFGLIVLSHGTN